MAILSASESSLIRADRVIREVRINGVLRTDADCDRVVQAAGFEPTTCLIKFPMRRSRETPANPGDLVEVWADRQTLQRPLFRGRVSSLSATHAPDSDAPSVLAQDARSTLADACCIRNYNIAGSGESLRLRAIVSAIAAEYTAFHLAAGTPASIRLQFNLASFPDAAVGEFICKGETYSGALQQLMQDFAPETYRLAVEYVPGASVVVAFQMGVGPTQNVVRGVDVGVAATAQPYGVVNAAESFDAEEFAQIVNDVRLESTDVAFEAQVQLTPAWPGANNSANFDALLSAAERGAHYALPGTSALDNDPALEGVGRRYFIPNVIDLDSVGRPLEIGQGLVQPGYYGGDLWNKLPAQPFLAWFRDARWLIRFNGFRVQGREVLLDEPWFETQRTTAQRDFSLPLLTPTTLYGGTTTYYVGDASRFIASVIASGSEGVFTAPNGAGTKLTIKSTSQALPDLPANANEIGWDELNGQFISTTQRVLFGRWTATTVRRLPVELYFNALWISQVPLVAQTGRTGPVTGLHVQRIGTVAGYQYRALRSHIQVLQEAPTVGTDFTLAYGVTSSGPDVVTADDGALLLAAAQARAADNAKPVKILTRILPAGDLSYTIGARLSENGQNTGCTIVEISYDLDTMTTQLTARSR